MQFSTAIIVSVLTSFAAAATVPITKRFDIPGFDCGITDGLKCVAALSPAAVACIGAAVQAGVDPIADAGCAVGVGNDAVNFPESCNKCF